MPLVAASDPSRMVHQSPDPEALVRRHQRALWRYLRALGAPADLAEDLLQDTFVVALAKLTDDRGDAATAAFLRHTARNLLLRRRRDLGRRAQILAEVADRLWCEHGQEDGGDAWLQALRACTEGLSGRVRQAIELFYGEERGREGTAAVLGMQPNGVRTLLQRARAALRECIERRLRGEA